MRLTRALLVDDMELLRQNMRETLMKLGFKEFVEAENGQQALDRLREAATSGALFDLMLIDINMPGMSGLETLRRCKHDPTLKTPPALVVSARTDLDSVNEAIQLGALDFVIKPFSTEIMRRKLERIFAPQKK